MLKPIHHKPTTIKASKPFSLPLKLTFFYPFSIISTPPDEKTPKAAVNQATKVII
jgi:hypothetical protein